MFFYEGQSCPVCHTHFGEQDDIVTCPECGAPHHRACWQKHGHCHFAADHGTDRQWAKETATSQTSQKNCPVCGKENPEFAEFCSRCGQIFDTEDWQSTDSTAKHRPPAGQYTPPIYGDHTSFRMPVQDPYGGVSRNERIGEFSVDEIVQVIGPNSAYYLPRFYAMTHGGSKLSWNWMAFLLPYNWLLYRKNLLFGILSFVFFTATTAFNDTLLSMLNLPTNAVSPQELTMAMQQVLSQPEAKLTFLIFFLIAMLVFVARIFFGLFGNYLYLKTVLRKAKKIKENPELSYSQNVFTTGGVSFALAALPEILSLFAYYIWFMFV